MDCDCDCHEPAALAHSLERVKNSGGKKLLKRVTDALARLGDASYRDKQSLLYAVWEQHNKEIEAKNLEREEETAYDLLKQATMPLVLETIWKRVCKQNPEFKERFSTVHVFLAYVEGFPGVVDKVPVGRIPTKAEIVRVGLPV
jgi:hypothetical protein